MCTARAVWQPQKVRDQATRGAAAGAPWRRSARCTIGRSSDHCVVQEAQPLFFLTSLECPDSQAAQSVPACHAGVALLVGPAARGGSACYFPPGGSRRPVRRAGRFLGPPPDRRPPPFCSWPRSPRECQQRCWRCDPVPMLVFVPSSSFLLLNSDLCACTYCAPLPCVIACPSPLGLGAVVALPPAQPDLSS